ncbi:MAG: hypothetical protein AAGA46_03520 [Cyanobacteria bacterium P01_F01_bin.13]
MQTTHPAAPLQAARPVAPSCPDRVSVLPRNGLPAPRCRLEGHVLELKQGEFEALREVWVRPNSLEAVIEARRALYPGWSIQATYEISPIDQQKWIGF